MLRTPVSYSPMSTSVVTCDGFHITAKMHNGIWEKISFRCKTQTKQTQLFCIIIGVRFNNKQLNKWKENFILINFNFLIILFRKKMCQLSLMIWIFLNLLDYKSTVMMHIKFYLIIFSLLKILNIYKNFIIFKLR